MRDFFKNALLVTGIVLLTWFFLFSGEKSLDEEIEDTAVTAFCWQGVMYLQYKQAIGVQHLLNGNIKSCDDNIVNTY